MGAKNSPGANFQRISAFRRQRFDSWNCGKDSPVKNPRRQKKWVCVSIILSPIDLHSDKIGARIKKFGGVKIDARQNNFDAHCLQCVLLICPKFAHHYLPMVPNLQLPAASDSCSQNKAMTGRPGVKGRVFINKHYRWFMFAGQRGPINALAQTGTDWHTQC